ncbi:hypothetical protein J3R74_000352 [Puniceicoccus vermicola]
MVQQLWQGVRIDRRGNPPREAPPLLRAHPYAQIPRPTLSCRSMPKMECVFETVQSHRLVCKDMPASRRGVFDELLNPDELSNLKLFPCLQGKCFHRKRRGSDRNTGSSLNSATIDCKYRPSGGTSPPADAGPPPPTRRRGVFDGLLNPDELSNLKLLPCLQGKCFHRKRRGSDRNTGSSLNSATIDCKYRPSGGTSPPADAGPPLLLVGGEFSMSC